MVSFALLAISYDHFLAQLCHFCVNSEGGCGMPTALIVRTKEGVVKTVANSLSREL